jgi:hypothetical protein
MYNLCNLIMCLTTLKFLTLILIKLFVGIFLETLNIQQIKYTTVCY